MGLVDRQFSPCVVYDSRELFQAYRSSRKVSCRVAEAEGLEERRFGPGVWKKSDLRTLRVRLVDSRLFRALQILLVVVPNLFG